MPSILPSSPHSTCSPIGSPLFKPSSKVSTEFPSDTEFGLSRSLKRQSRSPEFQFNLQERPHSRNQYFAGTYSPFQKLNMDPDDQTLWWKLFGLKLNDFYDWQIKIHQVDEFTSTYCGLIKTSPYFNAIKESHKQDLIKLLDAPQKVFDSIAEEFKARMDGKIQHRKFLVSVNGYELGLFRYGDTLYAVENRCPHQNGPLGLGDIEEIEGRLCVTCPWHHWRFQLDTGKSWQPYRADKPPANIFPVKSINGDLYIGFSQYNPKVFFDLDF